MYPLGNQSSSLTIQAASTTAEKATATQLAGTLFNLSSFTFPPLASPYPTIILSVHVLPGPQVGMIILEAELLDDHLPGASEAAGDTAGERGDMAVEVLTEFMEGCIPDVPLALGGASSVVKIVNPGVRREDGGVERTRKVSMALGRMLREAGHI